MRRQAADLVEVVLSLDPAGIAAIAGERLLFETLCLLADALATRRG